MHFEQHLIEISSIGLSSTCLRLKAVGFLQQIHSRSVLEPYKKPEIHLMDSEPNLEWLVHQGMETIGLIITSAILNRFF